MLKESQSLFHGFGPFTWQWCRNRVAPRAPSLPPVVWTDPLEAVEAGTSDVLVMSSRRHHQLSCHETRHELVGRWQSEQTVINVTCHHRRHYIQVAFM